MSEKLIVTEIKPNEIHRAAITLSRAFEKDPLMLWLFDGLEKYQTAATPLFETWIKYCLLYGKAYRTPGFESVALRKKPGDTKELSFWKIFRSGMLKLPNIMGKESFERLMQLSHLVTPEKKKHMQNQAFWYCWTLGTDPAFQGQGFGSALMKHTFALAKKDGLPCYLETASDASEAVHTSQGYQRLSTISLPNSDVIIRCMVNRLDK